MIASLSVRPLFSAALAAAAFLGAASARADLKANFEQEVTTQATTEASVAELIKDKHIVLVGGYMTEFYRFAYFTDARNMLERMVPKKQVDVYFPDWQKTASENIVELRAKLEGFYEAGGRKPLWVIGHSKGGQEIVQLALQTGIVKPELLKGPFEKLVSLQGTVGGSPVAAAGETGCELLKQAVSSLPPVEGQPTVEELCASIKTLDANRAKAANDEWANKYFVPDKSGALAAARALVNKALYFVRAVHWEPSMGQYSSVLRPDVISRSVMGSYVYLRFNCGGTFTKPSPNDGLVCLKDQIFDGWGKDLTAAGPLNNDHADYATNSLISNAGEEFSSFEEGIRGTMYREAFWRALLRTLAAE
jgi:hypothetical protein